MPKISAKHNIFIVLFDLYTIFIWLWLILELITKEKTQLPNILSILYLTVLLFYASDKEVRRWRKKSQFGRRKGEIFVFLWVLTLVVAVLIYLGFGKERGYIIPKDLPTIAGTTMIVYIITDYLKEEFSKKR